ncbi:MAG: fibronectin-binding domain-containing protein [Euryarchaeota archaeon]|nr:fibronectin-binding domain-containing protein [Euryarchaeota archaeon]
MKTEMSAFDVLAIAGEMQSLVGGYLDKVFHWEGGNFLFRVNVPGSGKREVVFQETRWLYIASERPEMPDAPSQFAVNLRKHLSNGRITSVSQREFDRIVVVEVQKEKSYQIIFEIFGEGNLIVVSEGKIVNAASMKQWKHREIRPGVEYGFPPSRFNPLTSDYESFKSALLRSGSDLVRTLATATNLGGQYAEEVCLRAGMDKRSMPKDLSEQDLSSIHAALLSLIDAVRSAPDAQVHFQNGTTIDATPIPLALHGDSKSEPFRSFSEALSHFLERRPEAVEGRADEELLRLRRQLDQQTETVANLERKSAEYARKAQMLYTRYVDVNGILSRLRSVSETAGWEKLREVGKEMDLVSEVIPSGKSVIIRLEDTIVQLDYTKGIEENADALYGKSKELREKLRGALEALKETQERIEKREEGLREEETKVKAKKTKEFWFERYKWFITSGGRLVLAGRDARSNDQVVKKHLALGDRFAHADVHGAPSVIVKEGSSASEEEMGEACIFALAHSKAWNSGAREGSAYWVLPDQVSKTPEAGEFVPRGGFVIRGKRNYMHHLTLELAVGEIVHEGERKVMCGPRAVVERISDKFVVIAPGDLDRAKVSGILSEAFAVPEEEISRILPPGNLALSERRNLEILG